jgi:DNA-nicking Smr family endonuclease
MVMEMDRKDSTSKRGSAVKKNGGFAEGEQPFEEPVRLPIEDALDLHAFAPKEIPSVVEEYLEACRQAGMSEVRLIHGKGTGAQRAVVRRLLRNLPGVLSFADAPSQAGGWGATLVRLKPLQG